jgi:hypothetical protein
MKLLSQEQMYQLTRAAFGVLVKQDGGVITPGSRRG